MSTQPDYAMLTVLVAVLVPLAVLAFVSYWIPLRLRFSMRALLIATTLLAVVLGLIVYRTR